MPFVHLANGDVKHLDNDELNDRYGNETPRTYRDSGVESAIIGIYPDDVEYEEEKAEEDNSADENEDQENL